MLIPSVLHRQDICDGHISRLTLLASSLPTGFLTKNSVWVAVSSLLASVLFAVSLLLSATPVLADPQMADLLIKNGRIFTANTELPWAQAIAIKNGKFSFVGDNKDAPPAAAVLNANNRLIVPGLIDSHAHPGYVDVEAFLFVEGDTPGALLASAKAMAEKHPEKEWLRLCCWPTDMFVRGDEGPKRQMLDAVLPDRLIWFESETAHDFWLNSKALERLRIDKNTPDPKPGMAIYVRDERGDPTGWIKEGAGVQHLISAFPVVEESHLARHRASVAKTLKILSSHGVTAVFDAGNKGFGDLTYSVISDLDKNGELPLRYFGTYQIFTPDRASTAIAEIKRYRKEFGSERLHFNSVKVFMDGINANRSASYLDPYGGSTSTVNTLLTVEELTELLMELHHEKLDLHVHSIGSRSARTVLDAVERAQNMIGLDFFPRVTLAHLAYLHPDDLIRIAQLGVIANFTPWWFGASINDPDAELLGTDRFANMYRAKSVVDSGATYTFSSDEWWGGEMLATYISPYLGMQVGHTRQYPKDWWLTDDDGVKEPAEERLSISDLLRGYTLNGAYQLRVEDELGSIQIGKWADFVILDQDVFTVDPSRIADTTTLAVFLSGELQSGETISLEQ